MQKGFKFGPNEILDVLYANHQLYSAQNTNLLRDVILWAPDFPADEAGDIARRLAQIQHPNIADIADIGLNDDQFFVVYNASSLSLFEQHTVDTRWQPHQVLYFTEQLVSGLQDAAEQRVYLQPELIFLTAEQMPVLLTFRLEPQSTATIAYLTQLAFSLMTGQTTAISLEQTRLPIPLEAFFFRATQERYADLQTWLTAFQQAVLQVDTHETTDPSLRIVPPPEPLIEDTQPRDVQQPPIATQSSAAHRRPIPCAAVILLFVTVMAVVAVILLAVVVFVERNDRLLMEATSSQITPTLDTATPVIIVNRQQPTITATAIGPDTATEIASNDINTAVSDVTEQQSTPTFTLVPPTELPATATPTLTQTSTITSTSTVTATPTVTSRPSSTVTNTASPTATYSPSITPTSPFTPIPFADGRRFTLYYDDYTFYIYNPSNQPLQLNTIMIEGVDANGMATGNSFSGELWAEFYEVLEPAKCVAIEVTQAPALLRPTVCTDYNAIITPQRSSNTVFWINDSVTDAFRVFWGSTEAGQCSLRSGICDIYFP